MGKMIGFITRKIQLVIGGVSIKQITHVFSDFDDEAKRKIMQDTAWADGLRGVAALFVVSSHLVLCYARALVNPCCALDSKTPYLFQRPILRLVAAGQSWVAIFFVLLGFVNSLKPLKMARSNESKAAADKLARSAIGRIFRLFLPATLVTVISWFICQLGFYDISLNSDAYWLYMNTPIRSSSLPWAFRDLAGAIYDTWMFGRYNVYDQPQWALKYLLQGSMMLILILLITINMTSFWRCITLAVISLWSVDWSNIFNDPWIGFTICTGALLAEINLSSIPSRLYKYSWLVSIPTLLISLIFMSYPTSNADRAPWSARLLALHESVLPTMQRLTFDKLYPSLGAPLLLFSIVISPHMRFLLSRGPLLWLGKISFAIYLLHGMVLRSVFAWVMFWKVEKQSIPEVGDNGQNLKSDWRIPLPGAARRAFATLIAGVVILLLSHWWNGKVEPIFARWNSRIEQVVRGEHAESGSPSSRKETQTLLPIMEDEGIKLG